MNFNLAKRNERKTSDLDLFRMKIDNIFDDFFNIKSTELFETDWSPAVDIDETKKEITVKAELPGIDEKNLKVTLEKNILTISGEKSEEKSEEIKDKKSIFRERFYGSFCRSISLPEGIKSDSINAEFKKGVLRITIPKEKTIESKKIQIEVH